MSQMSETSSKLICITGKPGSGKSVFCNFLKENNYEVFIMDEWVHQFYKIDNKGYELIKNEFGNEFVNGIEVDRKKLSTLIVENDEAKARLDKLMFKEMYKVIYNLALQNKTIFIELGIYLINPVFFKDLFKFVIAINSDRVLLKNPSLNNFYKNIKFSTKPVGNSKNLENTGVIFVNYLVENFGDLDEYKKNMKNLLEEIQHKI